MAMSPAAKLVATGVPYPVAIQMIKQLAVSQKAQIKALTGSSTAADITTALKA